MSAEEQPRTCLPRAKDEIGFILRPLFDVRLLVELAQSLRRGIFKARTVCAFVALDAACFEVGNAILFVVDRPPTRYLPRLQNVAVRARLLGRRALRRTCALHTKQWGGGGGWCARLREYLSVGLAARVRVRTKWRGGGAAAGRSRSARVRRAARAWGCASLGLLRGCSVYAVMPASLRSNLSSRSSAALGGWGLAGKGRTGGFTQAGAYQSRYLDRWGSSGIPCPGKKRTAHAYACNCLGRQSKSGSRSTTASPYYSVSP